MDCYHNKSILPDIDEMEKIILDLTTRLDSITNNKHTLVDKYMMMKDKISISDKQRIYKRLILMRKKLQYNERINCIER